MQDRLNSDRRRWPPGGTVTLALGLVAAALGSLAAALLTPMIPVWQCLALLGAGWLAAGLAVWSVQRNSRELDEITQALQRLVAGRDGIRLDGSRSGALGILARTVNQIAAQVETLNAQREGQASELLRQLRTDRSALTEQNQALRTAAGAAQDEARAHSEMLSSLSHELRTPLTGILGYAKLLGRSGLNADQAQQLDTLEKSARSLLGMINDLLDWSRIDAGRLRLNEDTLGISELIEDTCTLLAPLAYDKNLELVNIVYHDVPQQVRGDAQRLQQILTNLLSNAIKFTQRGEVVLRVMQEREDAGRSWIRFSVSDSGIGISSDQLARLFRPYHQISHEFNRSRHEGTGLGLSIARKLAELMGGKIEVSSEPGRGSTFSLLAPFTLIAQAGRSRSHDPRLAGRTVWMLESHGTARLALVHWLEFWGMRVRSFEHTESLQQALGRPGSSGAPDLVIASLTLANKDAPALRAMLERCRDAAPPLFALIGSGASAVHAELLAAGATACRPKWIGRQTLHDDVLRLLTRGAVDAGLPLSGQRVLVADNNLVNRRYLVELCRQCGLQTLEAEDGRVAFELWQRERPEHVLLDARMPNMDGASCARQIRAAENRGDSAARCNILAVSAHLEPEERGAFIEAGANAVLIKPFDENELLRRLSPAASGPSPTATRLASDPEMLALLQDELPKQFADLESAFSTHDLARACDAAHTLRGTAAFYKMSRLRQTTTALEDWLKSTAKLQDGPQSRRELEHVRRAVQDTLEALRPG
ncbi:MAG: ATP-binding protein [Pseudomonadota bacterium]|nr:ATP-binding protein [Pseudomonadota bacterium]